MGFLESVLTEMIDQKMRYSSQRVSVLAQNIANVDTPGFKAKDVQAPDFNQMLEENLYLTKRYRFLCIYLLLKETQI
jgi:flagellar basal-body rod protein FlgB